MPGSLHLQHLVKMSQIQSWRGLVREGGVLLNNYTCKMYVEGEEIHVGFQRKGTLPGHGRNLKGWFASFHSSASFSSRLFGVVQSLKCFPPPLELRTTAVAWLVDPLLVCCSARYANLTLQSPIF